VTARTVLEYARRGWHVFPLTPESKRPAFPDHRAADCTGTDPKCRAGHTGWEQRATTDPARITRAWTDDATDDATGEGWTSGEPYGVGIACGPSGLLVVDLDTPKPGEEPAPKWAELVAEYGVRTGGDMLAVLADQHATRVPATYTARTISGGLHLYFTAPPIDSAGLRLGNTAGSLGWLIDTRGWGGYVVAPPTSIAGHAYEVVDDRPPAPLPDWLAGALTSPPRPAEAASTAVPGREPARVPVERLNRYVAAAVAAECRKVTQAHQGSRNHTLFCAAVALGQLVAGGALPEETAHHALTTSAAVHVAAGGFTAAEAEATIRSGFTTGARNPRTPNQSTHNANQSTTNRSSQPRSAA